MARAHAKLGASSNSSRDTGRSSHPTLAEGHGFEVGRLRDLHFDTLIALTVRRRGAHLITCNAGDFRAIGEIVSLKLICWEVPSRTA